MDDWFSLLISKYPDMFCGWYTNDRLYVTNSTYAIARQCSDGLKLWKFNPDIIEHVNLRKRYYDDRELTELSFEYCMLFEEIRIESFEELEKYALEYYYDVEKVRKRLIKEERIKAIREL